MPYDPMDWYWHVGGDSTRVWSSARMAWFPIGDPKYASWLVAGRRPSRIATVAELLEVLVTLPVPEVTIASASKPALDGTYVIDQGGHRTAAIVAGLSASDFKALDAAIDAYVYAYHAAIYARLAGGTADLPDAKLSVA